MSEINNLSDIKENFDTIKSLLNSIRAQDVLNTSDMNKLLTSMNGKLDKLNQEENLDLMNSVLSTIKSTLDERHSVLISKFSAIESLFSNILKNSVDSLKSSEIKELFDIIATNLSVFSREVVSQKDTLTNIMLRIDELRADDGSSTAIMSNFDALKHDLERFNNGFESIVVNLNDNFGAIVHALDDVRDKINDNHYDKDFENLYMTSNSLLSSIQAIDQKSVRMEETLASILAKCDTKPTQDRLSELFLQNKEIYSSIGELAVNCNVEPLYQKIDNASSLIKGLKEILQNVDTDTTNEYIAKLTKMETSISRILDENDFRKVRSDLEGALNQIANSVNLSQNDLYVIKNDLETVASSIKALDIHVNFQNIQSSLTKSEVNIKTYISDLSNKFSQLSDLTFQRTVDDIKQKIDILGSEIKAVSGSNLEALAGSLIGLKSSISDLESASGTANGLLFKNISERLTALENTLSGLLNNQALSIGSTGKQMTELSSSINLKLDTTTAEFSSAKESIENLKSQLESILGIDFQTAMADIKVGIVTSQAELISGLKDTSTGNHAELIDTVNNHFDTLKQQTEECSKNLANIYKDGLSELRSLLNSITATLIDIVSYVSVHDTQNNSNPDFEKRFCDIEYSLKDYSADSVEKINSFIKDCIEKINTRLTNYDANTQTHFQNLATKIENNSTYIREDIKQAYDTLAAIKADIVEFKEYVIEDINNNPVKAEVIDRIAGLKNYIADSLNTFETNFSNGSLERYNELQILNNKIIQKIEGIPEANRSVLADVRTEIVNNIKSSVDSCVDNAIEDIKTFVDMSAGAQGIELERFKQECSTILENFKGEIPDLAAGQTNIADKIDEIQDKISTSIARELEKSYSSIAALIPQQFLCNKDENIRLLIMDLLASQESKIKASIVSEFQSLSEKFSDTSSDNKAVIINKLNDFESGIVKSLDKNELNYTKITEKIENFGNTLYKLVENGGVTVNTAIEKIDDLAGKILVKSGNNLLSLDTVIEKIEKLEADISKIAINESSVKTGEIIAELLEKTENTSSSLFSGIQQLSSSNAKYTLEINNSLEFIKSEIANSLVKNDSKEVITELEGIKNVLNNQLENVDKLYSLCLTISEAGQRNDISKMLLDFKTEIITQVITIFNQISFSSEQEEIVNFIKIQQDELKNTVSQLASTIDKETTSCEKIISKIGDETIALSEQIEIINNNVKSITVADNGSKYTLFNVEADIAKLRLALAQIKDYCASEEKQEAISTSLSSLINTINLVRSELPSETIEYLRAQIDKLIDGVKLNDAIASNIANIKDKLDDIEQSRAELRTNIEYSFNNVISTLAGISDVKELREYIKTGFDGLYNNIAEKIDLSGVNSELNALLSTIMAKQDASLAHIVANIATINNGDVIAALEGIKSEIITQVLSVFNQISFEADAIDIKAEIDDKNEELNSKLKKISDDIAKIIENQGELIEDYSNNLNRLEENLENNHVFQLKAISEIAVSNKELAENIEAVKDQLKLIQSSGDEDSYSLADVENDLTKLRLTLSDIRSSHNKKELESIYNSIDTVINQIQDIQNSIPMDKLTNINDNTLEVLDILEGLALELQNFHSSQDDIIGSINYTQSELTAKCQKINDNIEMSLEDFANEIKEFSKDALSSKLALVKNDIITQLIGVISQISFVEEQEELTTQIDGIDKKLNLISSGDPKEMGNYSLQDMETDVAKLRITLEEIKSEGRGKEIDDIVNAIKQAEDTLEYLKTEIPNHEISEIRSELEKIANDIISISIRTNKLLISSDESYKSLKEHIETFQNVMDEVDVRTKNLYEEVGMDKLEFQVTSIRDIVGRQELTNQVFNEVFEYLAEWIDSTGEKISYITDKLNNKDDINEIKSSLEELKNATSVKFELDAQSDKIDTMESKLNIIIESLEPTFQSHQERMQGMERKINKIIDFFEPAFTQQQERINKLEYTLDKILDAVSSSNGSGDALDRLEKISDIITSRDDMQLVKKLAGFEKQITKLNKNVEKLTSYANEK